MAGTTLILSICKMNVWEIVVFTWSYFDEPIVLNKYGITGEIAVDDWRRTGMQVTGKKTHWRYQYWCRPANLAAKVWCIYIFWSELLSADADENAQIRDGATALYGYSSEAALELF